MGFPVEGGMCPSPRTRQSSSCCPGSLLPVARTFKSNPCRSQHRNQYKCTRAIPCAGHPAVNTNPTRNSTPSTAHLPPQQEVALSADFRSTCPPAQNPPRDPRSLPHWVGVKNPPMTHPRTEQPVHRRTRCLAAAATTCRHPSGETGA